MAARRSVGLLAELYSKWERRSPLTPTNVKTLVDKGVEVIVQPSTKRIFTDSEYVRAGASISSDLSRANAIFGVKQPVVGSLLPEKTYVVFSHTIKAQPANMPLLDEFLDKKCGGRPSRRARPSAAPPTPPPAPCPPGAG